MDAGADDFDLLPTNALLALCLGGSADRAKDEAGRLSARFDLADLCRATPAHIRLAAEIPRGRSVRLAAAFALGRRVETEARRPRPSLRSPSEVHGLLAPEVRGAAQETFHALLLDGKHRLRRREQVSLGTLNSSLVHPREVFGPALREGAAALIVAHNHPSGDPEPSDEDLAVTRRLLEAGRILGVPLLDHVVIGDRSFVSIRERIRFEGG
jgi:DNA repair protein RadC